MSGITHICKEAVGMMTAKEAAEKADKAYLDVTNETIKKLLARIEPLLQKCIARGEKSFHVNYYEITEMGKKHLQSLGYKVTFCSGGGAYDDPSTYEIAF